MVRHGETVMNEEHLRQGSEGGLSETGKQQATELGSRLKTFPIQRIFTSTFQRALETTDIINSFLKVDIEKTELLAERKNPSSIIGKKYEDPLVVEKINQMDRSYHKADFRIEDEENFDDLKARAIKLKKFLERRASTGTLCVTHGIFLKMFLCIIKYGEDLRVEDYIKNSLFNPASNAGITILSLKKSLWPFSKPIWEIILYNETPIDEKSKSV